jgi:uncharacterized membrane protein
MNTTSYRDSGAMIAEGPETGRRLEHAGMVAAAPWLMLIAALLIIERISSGSVDADGLSRFRVNLVFTLGLSLIAAAPIASLSSRLLANAVYEMAFDGIWSMYLASLSVAMSIAAVLSLVVYGLVAQLPIGGAVVGSMACASTSLVWIALSTLSTVKDFRGITFGFAVGLAAATTASIFAALVSRSGEWMFLAFVGGLNVSFLIMSARLISALPAIKGERELPWMALWSAARRHRLLIVGATAAALGIWIDKVVVWSSRYGSPIEGGLVHAPLYDSPMFFASLTIIPSMALFSSALEQRFVPLYRHYFDGIARHDTLAEIERNSAALSRCTFDIFSRITLLQGAGVALMLLAAPAIVEFMQFRFYQLVILRWGCIGMALYLLFVASASILVFFNRYAWFAFLHIGFVVLCGALTYLGLDWGTDYLGFGFTVASLICGFVSIVVLDRTLREIEFITFIVNNSAGSNAH